MSAIVAPSAERKQDLEHICMLMCHGRLEKIAPEVRHLPEVLGMRVEIYRNLEKW